jgi:hypothetical protein
MTARMITATPHPPPLAFASLGLLMTVAMKMSLVSPDNLSI